MKSMKEAKAVLTDSGGVQEETTYFGVPCVTLRDSTERRVTITEGTNALTTIDRMAADIKAALDWGRPILPGLDPIEIYRWDGNTASRIALAIDKWLQFRSKNSE